MRCRYLSETKFLRYGYPQRDPLTTDRMQSIKPKQQAETKSEVTDDQPGPLSK